MEFKDVKWICEASEIEKLYDVAHKRGAFLLAYQLSLSSLQPIQAGQVETALIHLQRKCPALRVCFGQRDNKKWLRYMTKEQIDFQVVKDVGPDEVRDILHTYQYNSEEGPLWCSRLLFDTSKDPLALDEDLPYSSQLCFGLHHSVTDGLSILKFLGSFIGILNDVIANKSICDDELIGYFESDCKTEELVSVKVHEVQQNPSLMQELVAWSEEKGIGMPLVCKVHPSPEGEDKTCNLAHVVDRETTRKFIAKCKAEGVTIHSAFAALVDASIVTFMVENNDIQDSYRISNGHVINLRRYWEGDGSDAMGCHAHAPLSLWADVPRDLGGKFWDFARGLHQDLYRHLKGETALFREAYIKLCSTGEPSFDDIFSQENPVQSDCGLSNLGDATHMLPTDGPYVKPYLLKRHLSLHRTDIKSFTHFFHTFRGRFILNLLYNSKYYSKTVAKKHCSQIFSIMDKVINGVLY